MFFFVMNIIKKLIECKDKKKIDLENKFNK
jgi:hypothetical protein